MTGKLSLTAALTVLVACVGVSARADSLEGSVIEAGRRFDMTARSDNAALVNLLGAMTADKGPKLNEEFSKRGGPLKKEVPTPGYDGYHAGPIQRLYDASGLPYVADAVIGVSFFAFALTVTLIGVALGAAKIVRYGPKWYHRIPEWN